jgi:uncharacterized protein (TIRG00374 family)
VTVGVLAVAVLAAVVLWQRAQLARVGLVGLRLCRRVTGHPKRHEAEIVAGIIAELGRINLSWKDFLVTVGWSVSNWSTDCGCLAFSYLALHSVIPFQALLLAYGAGQLASNLPITPGGLGVVEGSLTIALVAYGGSVSSTVAAVLLYRIISFWGYIPIGWFAYLGIRLRDRRTDRAAAKAAISNAALVGAAMCGALQQRETPEGAFVPPAVPLPLGTTTRVAPLLSGPRDTAAKEAEG